MNKYKQTLPKIGLLLLSTLMTLLALEAGMRIWLSKLATPEQIRKYALYTEVESEKFQWSSHPYLNYYPTPGYEDGLTTHNSLGYRGPEFPVEKPDGEFRIVVLGGSTTYTTHVEDNALTFTAQLEQILREDYRYQQVRVINAGVAGYTSWESLVNLSFRVVHLDPDLVIIYHGTNDVHARLVAPAWYASDNTGKVKQWDDPPIPWFEKSVLIRVISRRLGYTRQVGLGNFVSSEHYRAYKYNSRTYTTDEDLEPENFDMALLEQNPPVFFERNLTHMVAIAQANGVEILLATWAHSPHFTDYAATPIYQQGFEENNRVVEQVAKATGVLFFDFASLMPQNPKYWADGRHINEAGALKKAELFAEFIAREHLIKPYEFLRRVTTPIK